MTVCAWALHWLLFSPPPGCVSLEILVQHCAALSSVGLHTRYLRMSRAFSRARIHCLPLVQLATSVGGLLRLFRYSSCGRTLVILYAEGRTISVHAPPWRSNCELRAFARNLLPWSCIITLALEPDAIVDAYGPYWNKKAAAWSGRFTLVLPPPPFLFPFFLRFRLLPVPPFSCLAAPSRRPLVLPCRCLRRASCGFLAWIHPGLRRLGLLSSWRLPALARS